MTANPNEPSHPDPLAGAPELCRLSAADLAAAYASGGLSPVEVAKAALERSHQINPGLNAFVSIDEDGALAWLTERSVPEHLDVQVRDEEAGVGARPRTLLRPVGRIELQEELGDRAIPQLHNRGSL